MIRNALLLCIAAMLAATSLRAELAQPNEPLIHIDEGRVYRIVNGEEIFGRDVLDVLVEEAWEKYLPAFVDYAIRKQEVERAKIDVPMAEVNTELKLTLDNKARVLGINADEIERRYGAGVVEALRRTVRVDLGLMKIFHNDKKLASDLRTYTTQFEDLKRKFVEKFIQLNGVEAEPAKLGKGEAVRIGTRSYPRDEVRQYILEAEGQITKSALLDILEQLKLERLVQAAAKSKGLALNDDDRKFHFSYLCRLKEQQTGVPGRAIMMQIIQRHGMTAEHYLTSRIFSFDALATLLVKQNIRLKQLQAEFAASPAKYKLAESLIAHIFVQVLDPDGHPYGPAWQADGHAAINAYSSQARETQFQNAKPKIDGLVDLAKTNFDETARKYSDDKTKRANGLIGRIGKDTIPARPLDQAAVNAAVLLKPSEVSAPVRSAYGWHIFKCLEKQDVTFEEVEERVYMTLISEARAGLFDQFKVVKIEDRF
ncbi:MAG: peptidylprolyl isomerase [Planctomycetota bacterium]